MKGFLKLLMAGMIMLAVGCGGSSDSDDVEYNYVTIKNTSQLSSSVIIGVYFYEAGDLGNTCTWTGGTGESIPAGGVKTFSWEDSDIIDIKVEFAQGGPANLWYAACMRNVNIADDPTLEFAKNNE